MSWGSKGTFIKLVVRYLYTAKFLPAHFPSSRSLFSLNLTVYAFYLIVFSLNIIQLQYDYLIKYIIFQVKLFRVLL